MTMMRYTTLAARLVAAALLPGGLAACAQDGVAAYGAQPATATAPAAPIAPGGARALAAQRLEAIARGDAEAVLRGYRDDAVLHWVGGPLDGTYAGREQLGSLWRRFATAQGPLRITLGTAVEGANPRGATVMTPVVLTNDRGSIRVRHTVVLRDGAVANETWQIDPALAV